jgi:hypothetical protein
MISNLIWNAINKLEFPLHKVYDPNNDKIPSVVLDYLERTRRIYTLIPIGYVNSDKVQKFVYDDFSEELKIFLKQQQKRWFSYPSANVMMKANYLNLYVRNKLNSKKDETWIQSSESFVRYAYREYINVNIAAFDEGSMVMNADSNIWKYLVSAFNLYLYNDFDTRVPIKNWIIVFKKLYFSTRSQFYGIFTIYREEIEKNCFRLVINLWLVLKRRGEVMLPSTVISQTLVNYQAVQSWVFIGNFILEDLVNYIKFGIGNLGIYLWKLTIYKVLNL